MMEDEQGAVGQGSGGGASAPPLSDNSPSESPVENHGVYEEGDGEEIMVEVVGSDVYVDGIGAPKEGHFESGEVRDLNCHVAERTEGSEAHNLSEAMNVSIEGDGLGLSDSIDKNNVVITEEVDGSFSKSVDVKGDSVSVPNPEVSRPSPMVIGGENRIEDEGVAKDSAVFDEKLDTKDKTEVLPSMDDSASCGHFSSQASGPTEEVSGPSPVVISEEKKEVMGPSPIVIGEENRIEDEGVTKDSVDLETSKPLGHEEAVFDEKLDTKEEKEVLPSMDNSAGCGDLSSQVSEEKREVTGPSAIVISEDKKSEVEGVSIDSSDLVTPETLNYPTEAVLDEKSDLEEKKQVSVPSEEIIGPLPAVINAEEKTEDEAVIKDSADVAIPERLNHPGEDVLDEKADHFSSPVSLPEEKRDVGEAIDKDSTDLVSPEPSNHPSESVFDEKGCSEEKKEVLLSGDNSAGGLNEEIMGLSPVVIREEEKCEGEGVSEGSSDFVTPEALNHPAEAVSDEKADFQEREKVLPSISEEKKTEGEGVSEGSSDFVTPEALNHPAAESVSDEKADIDEREKVLPSVVESDTLVPDVQDENRGCLNELNDAKLESDRIKGVSHAGPESIHDNSFVSEREEAIGNDECLKSNRDLETRKADENQVFPNETSQLTKEGDMVEKDKCLKIEFQDDKERNEPNTTRLSFPSDKEIATTLGAEMDGQDAPISQSEPVDDGGSSEKGMEINPEIPALDDSENMHILEEGGRSKVETEDVKVIEDDVMCHNPDVTSESFENVFQISGSPHITKQEVYVQITESSNHEVDKIENNNLTPNDASATTQVCISPERTEKTELLDDIKEKPGCDIASSSNEVYKSMQEDHEPRESNGFCAVDDEEERESDHTHHGGPEVETDKSKLSSEEKVNDTSSFRMEQSGYLSPPEHEGNFVHSDLVWGKVRSHPWWPGQIFDPSDASEKALKYHKKDSYLVAYFGDQTFAWNDSSSLKPFRPHFSHIEKQSNSESFHNAVNCALEEVERRVELGLACSCISKDAYAKIETQVVENTGICNEASRRHGVDQSTLPAHFEPDKLLEYVTGLAARASSRADLLDLVIARAQLSAFCRFKGYRSPTEFPLPGELLENDEQVSDEMAALKKRRHIPKDGSWLRREKSLTEREYSPDGEDIGKSESLSIGKKRKAVENPVEGSDKRVTVHAAKISTSASQTTPKPSFKIGECIRRVASQLTGATSSVKASNDEMGIDASGNINEQAEKQVVVVPTESLSVNEMLSQLELLAQDPKKRHNIQNSARSFFSGFRSSIVLNKRGRKKKSELTKGGSGEEFEFDDVNDSYWTDRIVQNYSEEQILDGDRDLQLVPFGSEKPVKTGRKSHSRKRFSSSPNAASEEEENAKRRKQESNPAELMLSFAERNCIPSEINLNKMFRRFGPLMESETEVDHESGWAKVIFKRGSDAEVARNSAEKFNIFGPVAVDYQIGYSPVISVKILPVALPQAQEDEAMML